MAKKDILSTSEFLSTMRKTPLGSTTNLTFSDAEALSRSGIDISNYGNATETNEFSDALTKEKQESSGWWDEAIGTLDNLANNFGRGFVGMFEGIVDFAVSLAGNVGSWFGADTQWAEDFIDIDFAGKMADWTQLYTPWSMIRNSVKYGTEYWDDVGKTAWGFLPFTTGMGGFMVSDEEMAEWMDKYTYSNDWLEEESGWFGDIAQNVAQGAGQLVGMYLTGGIGKAAGLGAKGAQAVSLGAMSIGAAGKGTEEALNEGANLGQATVYGLLSGATEAATEMLGGVAGDFATGVIGKAALKNAAVRKFTSTLAGKMIAGFISEGFEEVLSDVVNPIWKKISYDYDLDLANEYSSGEFWAGLAQSFVVGGIVGAIGTGVTYQRLGKTTINDKKVGQKAAIAYGEYADNLDDLHKAAKKLNKTFSQIVEEANIDIAERTNIDKAMEQVRTNPDLSETQRSKLERAIKKAYEANTQYVDSQNKLLGELESAGITAEDLAQDYQNKLNIKAQEVAEKYDIDIENADAVNDAIKSNTEIMNDITEGNVGSFYDNNGKLVVVGQNAVTEQVALNSMEQLKTKNVDIYNDFMEIADTLMTMDETFSTQVDKFAQIYQTQNNMSIDEATTLAKQTAMANRIASYYANKPSALSSVDNLRKIADIMSNSLAGQITDSEVNGLEIVQPEQTQGETVTPEPMLPTETTNPLETMEEEMGALVRTMEEPALQKKIRVGKSNIKSTATWLDNISYNTETLAVKLTNSAYSIEKGFRAYGYSVRDAMLKVEKVRMATSIGNNVCLDGFYTTNDNGTITRTTLGLRNGKTGIADILEKSFRGDLRGANAKKAIEQGFSTFYESLALYVEQDRLNASLGTELVALEDIAKLNKQQSSQSDRKTVFGRWLETRTMPSDLLVEISENLPLLSEAISKGVALDEATFETLARKTALESNVELSGDALETYNKAKDYLRLLNQEDIDTRLAEIDRDFPQFKEMREEVWKINRELLKIQYENGYLTKEAYEWMKKNYSHYVPTYREMIMRTNSTISMSLDSSTLKAAKGSDLVIRDIFDSMQSQIIKIEQKVALNELIKDFINAGKGQDTLNRYIIGEEITNETQLPRSTDSSMTYYLSRPALDGNMLSYYEGGQAHTYLVNNNVMEGFQSLAGVYRQTLLEIPGMKFMAKAQGLVKNLLTTYNPFFSLRNAIRDLWDASFYSPTGMTSVLRHLPKAYKSIVTNDANYQSFVANGGIGSSIMTTTDIYTEKPKRSNALEYIVKPWKAIERVNEIIETSTRYAQYLATTEKLFKERAKGKNDYSNKQIVTRGVYEAHEITLNFSRAGTVTRQINNTFGMFLNASVQGFTKMVRTFISPKSAKEWAELIFKCIILGIGTQLLNELLYYDDEDYKALNTSIKNNYYLIKAGDQFIRIPKGRVISAFNAFVTAGFNYENGDKNAFQDALSYALEANAPISGFGFGFFQGIADTTMNRTWYGGEIVGSEWDNTRPSEQYEKSTSNISKWLGKVFNVSPLKIEYILDQYSGIVGDILLPMTSDEGGFDKLKQIVKDQYLIDPTEKNKYSSDFYNYREQVLYDKTDGDAIATIQASYMTTAVSEIKELRAQIEEIENNSNLSADEKDSQTKTIRVMINASYKAALQNAKDIGEALKYYTITEMNASEAQREVYREVLGAESALRLYNKKLYSKAKSYYKAGVSYDDFYVYYFNLREMSTKQEAEAYISRLRISANLKNLIYRLAGWSLDDEKTELLTAWLKRKGLTDEEIDMIL